MRRSSGPASSLALMAVVLAAALGCGSVPPAPPVPLAPAGADRGVIGSDPNVYGRGERIVSFAAVGDNVLKVAADQGPILEYLGSRVGVRFRLVFQPRYQDIIDALATGRVDLAWLSPQTYVAARARAACAPVVQILRDGDTHYDGVVLVRKADAGAGLAGLRRRRFAFIDRDSASGYHYPLRWLRAQGAEPEAFFDSVAFAQSHSNALLRLQNGTYDAVATERGILRRYAGKLDVAAFEVLAVTGRIPNGPIAAREGFDPVLARGMADVLVGMRGSPEGSRIIAQLEPTSNVSGFASVEAGVYDEVHAVVVGGVSVAGTVTATAPAPAATAPGSAR